MHIQIDMNVPSKQVTEHVHCPLTFLTSSTHIQTCCFVGLAGPYTHAAKTIYFDNCIRSAPELQQVDIEYIPCDYLQFDKQKLFYTYQQLAVTRDILL